MTRVSAPEKALAELLRLAVRAPSGDNCQPWSFRRAGGGLDLVDDRERGRHFMCVQGNATYIAHGALLENMDIAARGLGFALKIALFPHGEKGPVVASLRLEPGEKSPDPLAAFIEMRCTNRKPYRREPLSSGDREALLSVAKRFPGGELRLVEGEDKDKLARVCALSERLLFDNKSFHDDLYRWVRWTAEEAESTRDGLYLPTLELSGFDRMMFRLLRSWKAASLFRLLGAGAMAAQAAAGLYRSCSAIGFIQAPERRPASFVTGGRLLQRVWLAAAARGLSFQPITGVPILIDKLHYEGEGLSDFQKRLILDAEKQAKAFLPLDKRKAMVFMFRVGRGEAPSAMTLRREAALPQEGAC